MPTNWVPTQTFKSFIDSGGSVDPIPPSQFEVLVRRVDSLESVVTSLESRVAYNATQIIALSSAARKREFAYLASDAIVDIGGGLWKVCGAYRCFETMTLDFVRGFSMDWPSGSAWQINAMRSDGSVETQNITTFSFDITPSITLEFQAGDIISILVRNFDSTVAIGTDENPAMCSIVFTRAVA